MTELTEAVDRLAQLKKDYQYVALAVVELRDAYYAQKEKIAQLKALEAEREFSRYLQTPCWRYRVPS